MGKRAVHRHGYVTESIAWHRVEDVQPDDGITMLLFVPGHEASTVWPGYLEADEWFWACGSKVKEDVVAWAEMPVGLPTG